MPTYKVEWKETRFFEALLEADSIDHAHQRWSDDGFEALERDTEEEVGSEFVDDSLVISEL